MPLAFTQEDFLVMKMILIKKEVFVHRKLPQRRQGMPILSQVHMSAQGLTIN